MVISSLSHSKNFNTNFPIIYRFHSGTAIYVGYNTDLANLDPNLGVEPVTGAIVTTRNGCINDSRYVAIQRLDAIQPAFDAILKIVDEVIAIDREVAERAKQIVLAYRHLSARDAVHVAVMEQHRITRILSFDPGFDNLPGVTRIC